MYHNLWQHCQINENQVPRLSEKPRLIGQLPRTNWSSANWNPDRRSVVIFRTYKSVEKTVWKTQNFKNVEKCPKKPKKCPS